MYHLLRSMIFHLITGFGESVASFYNDEDPMEIGQGVLQGTSSAAPIFNMNSDVSLSAYRQLGKGATFTNPITGDEIGDMAVQYVDDETQFLNHKGAKITDDQVISDMNTALHCQACHNSSTWSDLPWISWGTSSLSEVFCFLLYSLHKFFVK